MFGFFGFPQFPQQFSNFDYGFRPFIPRQQQFGAWGWNEPRMNVPYAFNRGFAPPMFNVPQFNQFTPQFPFPQFNQFGPAFTPPSFAPPISQFGPPIDVGFDPMVKAPGFTPGFSAGVDPFWKQENVLPGFNNAGFNTGFDFDIKQQQQGFVPPLHYGFEPTHRYEPAAGWNEPTFGFGDVKAASGMPFNAGFIPPKSPTFPGAMPFGALPTNQFGFVPGYGRLDFMPGPALGVAPKFGFETQMPFGFGMPPTGSGAGRLPLVNIWEQEDCFKLEAEVPGVSLDDLELQVAGQTLFIKTGRIIERQGEKARLFHAERTNVPFVRAIHLPSEIVPEKVDAKLLNGVLELTLAKAAPQQRRSIRVHTVGTA